MLRPLITFTRGNIEINQRWSRNGPLRYSIANPFKVWRFIVHMNKLKTIRQTWSKTIWEHPLMPSEEHCDQPYQGSLRSSRTKTDKSPLSDSNTRLLLIFSSVVFALWFALMHDWKPFQLSGRGRLEIELCLSVHLYLVWLLNKGFNLSYF